MINETETNADRWAFHFRMSGYDAGSNGLPLNPEFIHEQHYIQGYAVGILEWQKKLELIHAAQDEANWIAQSAKFSALFY